MSAADINTAAAATVEDLHHDVLTAVLRCLDGPALATAGCATTSFRSLAAQPHLWEDLCLSTWPSLRHPRLRRLLHSSPFSYRSFFSDAHTFPHPAVGTGGGKTPPLLISAVDLLQRGEPVFSAVVETDARGPWFLCSPFQVDALAGRDPSQPAPVISCDDLTLSWVVIDAAGHRSVNLSSRRPVSVERQWYTGEMVARFAAVLDGGAAAATVMVALEEETMELRQVSLVVEDMDGMCLNGKESLEVIQGALGGRRKGRGGEGECDARWRYVEYAARKQERKERRLKQEGRRDMFYMVLGVALFLACLALVALG